MKAGIKACRHLEKELLCTGNTESKGPKVSTHMTCSEKSDSLSLSGMSGEQMARG